MPMCLKMTSTKISKIIWAKIKARKLEISFTAESGQAIAPNDSLRRIGESALEHGEVVGEGVNNNGVKVARSSRQSPREIIDRYDPEEEAESSAFRRMVGK
jgi:hypothetical protein